LTDLVATEVWVDFPASGITTSPIKPAIIAEDASPSQLVAIAVEVASMKEM